MLTQCPAAGHDLGRPPGQVHWRAQLQDAGEQRPSLGSARACVCVCVWVCVCVCVCVCWGVCWMRDFLRPAVRLVLSCGRAATRMHAAVGDPALGQPQRQPPSQPALRAPCKRPKPRQSLLPPRPPSRACARRCAPCGCGATALWWRWSTRYWSITSQVGANHHLQKRSDRVASLACAPCIVAQGIRWLGRPRAEGRSLGVPARALGPRRAAVSGPVTGHQSSLGSWS
jgi:hypothetical protein